MVDFFIDGEVRQEKINGFIVEMILIVSSIGWPECGEKPLTSWSLHQIFCFLFVKHSGRSLVKGWVSVPKRIYK